MNQLFRILLLFAGIFGSVASYSALPRIVVASDGSGDFRTITAAIASLPMFNYERRVIYIKNGIYSEKIRIEQDNVTLQGESREKTVIRYFQPRPEWIAKKDSIGPGVINILGDDLIIENLTFENTQTDHQVHAFVLYGHGTRTILLNCSFISQGGL
jgi:pectinesterase